MLTSASWEARNSRTFSAPLSLIVITLSLLWVLQDFPKYSGGGGPRQRRSRIPGTGAAGARRATAASAPGTVAAILYAGADAPSRRNKAADRVVHPGGSRGGRGLHRRRRPL